MSIEEMLKAGKKPEEMMQELNEQIKQAQEKINQESCSERDARRNDLAAALLNYLVTFDEFKGMKEFESNKDNVMDMERTIKESEDMIKSLISLVYTFGNTLQEYEDLSSKATTTQRGSTSDDIISNFLKGII